MRHLALYSEVFFAALLTFPYPLLSSAGEIPWEKEASWRIWVDVPPSPLKRRTVVRPAHTAIDFAEIVTVRGESGKVLTDAITEVQWDVQSRNPQ